MPEEIKCPNPKCQSTNIYNRHAEQNIAGKVEGKPLQWPEKRGPKYECLNCGYKF